MAVRFSADGQDFTRTVSLGTVSQFSVICWVKISTDRNTNSTVWTIDNGNSDYYAVATNTDGTTMKFFTESNSSGNAQNFTVGTWYAVATSINGVNGSMWTRSVTDTSWTSITWSNGTATTTGTTFRIGEHPGTGLWLNGAIANMKVWNGVTLGLADFESEVRQYRPRRTANLVAWFPFLVTETMDHSGNGWTLSGGSGTTTEDGPPIGWGSDGATIFLPSAPSTIDVQFSATLGPVTGSFTVAEKITSTFSATLPALTGTFDVDVKVSNELSATLPPIVGSFLTDLRVQSTFASTLPLVTGAFTVAEEISTSLAATLPPVTGDFTVDAEVSITQGSTLPPVTGSFTVDVEAISTTFAMTLPPVDSGFTVIVRGITGIDAVVTTASFLDRAPTGPALEREIVGPALLYACDGPATVTISLTGPALGVRSSTGPATERVIEGPATEREIDGVVI